MSSDTNNITALREHLFAALAGLRDKTLDLERAKAISEVAQTIINSAKVEVEYLRIAGAGESAFLEASDDAKKPTQGITGSTVHRIKG